MKNNKKKKYMLLGTCVLLVILIFIRNIIPNAGGSKGDTQEEKEIINSSEAYRLLNFLWETPHDMTGEAMSCGEFRDALFSVCDALNLDYSFLITRLPERLLTLKEEDAPLYLEEFLFMYGELLTMMREAGISTAISEKTVYILGYEGMPLGMPEKTKSYEAELITSDGEELILSLACDYSDLFASAAQEGTDENGQADFVKRTYEERLLFAEGLVDKSIRFLCSGNEIIYCIEETQEEYVLYNVWVIQGEERSVVLFAEGLTREFESQKLSENFAEVIADITLSSGKVVGVKIKQGTINGKVLMADNEHIEIEGYGKLPLDEHYRIYKVYGELELEKTNGILVGYSNTNFIVLDGKICAALITEKITAKNIRVLIKNDGFKLNYHETVVLTADREFFIKQGNEERGYKAGDTVSVSKDDVEDGRLTVTTSSENAKITLLSVKRSYGNPAYRGTIEIAKTEEGLIIVNELSLEEYLYAVLPSEMPTNYGLEALKAQAVCARSYAYNQLMANRFSSYGAHVDDSVNCQVYNNMREDENSIYAVKETYGKVMEYKGNVITAFYFSTSCGHTTDIEHVWGNAGETPYLAGGIQTEKKPYINLSDEKNFRAFIAEKPIVLDYKGVKSEEIISTYDSGFSLYRWQVTITAAHLTEQFDEILSARYQADKGSVLTEVSKEEAKRLEEQYGNKLIKSTINNKIYVSKQITTIGKITDAAVLERGTGGIITKMLIKGEKANVLICFQTNVRMLFAPVKDTLYRADGTKSPDMSMLPSAFFVIDKINQNGEHAFVLTGGGYGHGLGMSQNGAKTMAAEGKKTEEILEHYYPGISLKLLYQGK